MNLATVHLFLASANLFLVIALGAGLPRMRQPLSIVALAIATWVTSSAVRTTFAEHVSARAAVAGDIAPAQKEMVLGEAFADGLPRLALAALVLIAAGGWSLFALQTRRARLASLAVVGALFCPVVWLATRGIGLHDRSMRESFADVALTDDGCLALESAVASAGSIEEAAKYEPRTRKLAHECVALWLQALDQDGEEKHRLERHAQTAHALMRLKGSTALDLIEESRLLVDHGQRDEVLRRKALTSAAE